MNSYFDPRTRLYFAWACFAVHAFALLAVLLVLEPGIPPGDIARRAEYVARHAIGWQIGWGLWLPASLGLVLFHAGFADALNARAWGWIAVGITLAGAVFDWADEMVWIWLAPDLALRFASDPFAANAYTLWDRAYMILSIGLANALYTIGGIILIALAYQTRGFPRWLARWGAVVWALSIVLSYAGLIGDGIMMQSASALVFVAFMPWLVLCGYGWLVRADNAKAPADRLSFKGVVSSMIPKHPIPMRTSFRDCLLINFAIEPDALRSLVPEPIELDLYEGKAYLSIVIAAMEKMRPDFAPSAAGVSYNQVVYRVVVKARGERGVYFLRSDANNWAMSIAGDALTFFKFHTSEIGYLRLGEKLVLDLESPRPSHANIHAIYDLSQNAKNLPIQSNFRSLIAAKEFLVELFALFAYDPFTAELFAVHIDRGEWDLSVLPDDHGVYEWMQQGPFFNPTNARLDSIFYAREIPYHWQTLEKLDLPPC